MEKKSMGNFIAALRKANGMTQQDLAFKLNVSNKTVSKWECDETYPDISLIPVIAEILEVSCDELLKGGRILREDDGGKDEKKITKQVKRMVDSSVARFKLYSLINILFIVVGVLINYIISYSAYRPDIGFGIMIVIFAVCVTLEVVALMNLNGKFSDRELLDDNGIDLESSVNVVKRKYAFTVFYLAFCLIYLTFPLTLTYSIYGGPTERVITFGYYLEILPFFIPAVIMGFLPAKSLSKTVFAKARAPRADKRIIIFEFIQLAAIACCLLIGYNDSDNIYDYYMFSTGVLIFFLIAAFIIAAATIVFLCSKKIAKADKKLILLATIRNMIYLLSPLIALLIGEDIAFLIMYFLIAAATAGYAFFIRNKSPYSSNPKI